MDKLNRSQNDHIYQLVRANILSAVKGSYFIDYPNQVVHKLDRLFVISHDLEHELFMEQLIVLFDEMKADFTYDIGEYDRITVSLASLKKFISSRLLDKS